MKTNIYEAITLLGVYRAKKVPNSMYLDFVINELKNEFDDIPENDWETINGAIIEELLKLDECDIKQLLKYHEEIVKESWTEIKVQIPGTDKLIYINKALLKDVLENQFHVRMVERIYPSCV